MRRAGFLLVISTVATSAFARQVCRGEFRVRTRTAIGLVRSTYKGVLYYDNNEYQDSANATSVRPGSLVGASAGFATADDIDVIAGLSYCLVGHEPFFSFNFGSSCYFTMFDIPSFVEVMVGTTPFSAGDKSLDYYEEVRTTMNIGSSFHAGIRLSRRVFLLIGLTGYQQKSKHTLINNWKYAFRSKRTMWLFATGVRIEMLPRVKISIPDLWE